MSATNVRPPAELAEKARGLADDAYAVAGLHPGIGLITAAITLLAEAVAQLAAAEQERSR